MKFKIKDGWDKLFEFAKKKGKSCLIWMDNEDGTLDQWIVYPDKKLVKRVHKK
jgi:hypothetical protein